MSMTGMTPAGKKRQVDLQHMARMVERGIWPAPSARDWRSGKASDETYGRNSRPLNEVVTYLDEDGDPLLNPAWVTILMGFPPGWVTGKAECPEPSTDMPAELTSCAV